MTQGIEDAEDRDELESLPPRERFLRAKADHFLRKAEECIQMSRFTAARRFIGKADDLDPENPGQDEAAEAGRAGHILNKRDGIGVRCRIRDRSDLDYVIRRAGRQVRHIYVGTGVVAVNVQHQGGPIAKTHRAQHFRRACHRGP